MSCCRRRPPRTRIRATYCVNCRRPLRDLVRAEVERLGATAAPGNHRETATLPCPDCQYKNLVPIVFTRR